MNQVPLPDGPALRGPLACGGSRRHRCVPSAFVGAQRAPGVGGTYPAPACPWGKRERGIKFLAAAGHFCHADHQRPAVSEIGHLGADALSVQDRLKAVSTVAMILDRRISLPRFHSHCFSSLTFELRACWVPFCESMLPSINRPWAEIEVAST